jgi:hypothetical protein
VFTPGRDTLVDATADVTGDDLTFNLSHVCPGTTPPAEWSAAWTARGNGAPGAAQPGAARPVTAQAPFNG